MISDYLIIGAGIAGLSAASRLRQISSTAQIVLINGEDRLPYKRTKLSKMLYCGWSKEELAIYPATWYSDNRIQVIAGHKMISIDPQSLSVTLDDGSTWAGKKILLALGSEPLGIAGNLSFREAQPAEAFLQGLKHDTPLSILGNGVLAIELAEQAALLGKAVTLYARQDLPMRGEFNLRLSRQLAALLVEHKIKTMPLTQAPKQQLMACIGTRARALSLLPDLSDGKGGLAVSKYLETRYAQVWAAGDGTVVDGSSPCHLWHQAEAQGWCAANNMASLSPLEKLAYLDLAYRLKLEVFGQYYFSMNYHASLDCACLERNVGPVYQAIYHRNNRVEGLLMSGDKERNKDYEKAVREKWPLAEFVSRLS